MQFEVFQALQHKREATKEQSSCAFIAQLWGLPVTASADSGKAGFQHSISYPPLSRNIITIKSTLEFFPNNLGLAANCDIVTFASFLIADICFDKCCFGLG